jgi:hypothetical protein
MRRARVLLQWLEVPWLASGVRRVLGRVEGGRRGPIGAALVLDWLRTGTCEDEKGEEPVHGLSV